MPNRNGTGPFGDGRLGKGLGPCGRTDIANDNRRGFRRGMNRCFGGFGGFGHMRWRQNAEMSESNSVYTYDKETLQNEKSRLEKLLNWVNERLTESDK